MSRPLAYVQLKPGGAWHIRSDVWTGTYGKFKRLTVCGFAMEGQKIPTVTGEAPAPVCKRCTRTNRKEP